MGLNLIDMVFVFSTVFDVVRNQYFYLGETVLSIRCMSRSTMSLPYTGLHHRHCGRHGAVDATDATSAADAVDVGTHTCR